MYKTTHQEYHFLKKHNQENLTTPMMAPMTTPMMTLARRHQQ
ncbi:9667_t:CDS:2 [Racocetra fulgida]|uniref:9667_t:CDS:1 n=1 Tax=Racocetra fulgida TaxID=60492 RepID=A0A9N9ADR5_9GLOM|nr:9667_t:CDS:2 [Racocetra fulgida]